MSNSYRINFNLTSEKNVSSSWAIPSDIRDYVWDNFEVTDTGYDFQTGDYEMMFNAPRNGFAKFADKYGGKLKTVKNLGPVKKQKKKNSERVR
jgi:hypothetical protein